jgi:rSAM/selenodomain-associated transferase 2
VAAADIPWLSVIVPVLNESGTLGKSLLYLQPLRGRGAELIVVDGGSTDGSREQAAALADRVLRAARGRSRQMRAGAEVARGRVLWFLHADTCVPESAADLIRSALAGTGEGWGWFDVRLTGRQVPLRCVGWLMNRRARLTRIATGDQGLFLHRTLYDRAGGFPDIPLMEDIALCRRLRRLARPRPIGTPLLTSSRRWEKHGILRTILTMWTLRLGFFLGVDARHLARYYAAHRP